MYVDPNISRNQPVAGRRIGRSCGCIIALSSLLFIVVALLVAGGIWWSSGVSLAGFELPEPLADLVRSNRLMSAPPVALVLEEDGALTGLALVNRPVGVRIERNNNVDYTDVPIYLSVYDPAAAELSLRWEVEIDHEANPGDLKPVSLTQHGDLLLATVGTELIAYAGTDGAERWRSPLSDVVNQSCQGCLRAADGVVAVLTLDNIITAFDTNSGQSLWQYRLVSDQQPLTHNEHIALGLTGGHLIVMDEAAEANASRLVGLDMTTGAEAFVIMPTCEAGEDQGVFRFDPVILDEAAGEATIMFTTAGFGPVCQQSWDLQSGTERWTTVWPEEIELPFGVSYGLMASNRPSEFFALDSQNFYLAVEPADGNETTNLLVVDRASGALQVIDDNPTNAIMAPVVAEAGTVVVQLRSTRGSEKDELWVYDTNSGQNLWRYALHPTRRFGVDTGIGPVWAVALDGGDLIVIESGNSAAQFQVSRFDLASGGQQYQTTRAMDEFAQNITALYWSETQAFTLAFGEFYAIDLATGELSRVWP